MPSLSSISACSVSTTGDAAAVDTSSAFFSALLALPFLGFLTFAFVSTFRSSFGGAGFKGAVGTSAAFGVVSGISLITTFSSNSAFFLKSSSFLSIFKNEDVQPPNRETEQIRAILINTKRITRFIRSYLQRLITQIFSIVCVATSNALDVYE